jgi:hypothetical protein
MQNDDGNQISAGGCRGFCIEKWPIRGATINVSPHRARVMDQIRQTLQKILMDAVRRAPAEDLPLLAWPLACGAAVAEKTRTLAFADGELLIQVPDAAWRTQMLNLTGEYLRQLREITEGRIQRLRFVLASEVEKR